MSSSDYQDFITLVANEHGISTNVVDAVFTAAEGFIKERERVITFDESARKTELLLHYMRKPLAKFRQYDFFANETECACGEGHDTSGGAAYASDTFELMRGADVRLLINPEASKSDVLRGLMMLAQFVNDDFEPKQQIDSNLPF